MTRADKLAAYRAEAMAKGQCVAVTNLATRCTNARGYTLASTDRLCTLHEGRKRRGLEVVTRDWSEAESWPCRS